VKNIRNPDGIVLANIYSFDTRVVSGRITLIWIVDIYSGEAASWLKDGGQ